MKRDWDQIRDVLLEVESLSAADRDQFSYGIGVDYAGTDALKAEHALLLWKARYIDALDSGCFGQVAIQSPSLTWAGHDLLDTLRSKAVWERVKSVAKDKGIELTFDAVKLLGKQALDWVIGQN